MARTRYIEVPAKALRATLREIGRKVEDKGGAYRFGTQGDEVIFTLDIPQHVTQVKVYTSLGQGDAAVRGCGDDAIRVCVGAVDREGRFRPLRKSRKVLRTAPKGTDAERLAAFLDRLTSILRDAYVEARSVPRCPDCTGPMSERDGRRGPFWGCLEYPACRGTREMRGAA